MRLQFEHNKFIQIDSNIFEYSEKEFEDIVHAIYNIDDIEQWKVNKKLNFMKTYKKYRTSWVPLSS